MGAHHAVAFTSAAQEALVRQVVAVTSDLTAARLKSPEVLRVLLERLGDLVLPTSDPLARARLRGAIAQRELLAGDGGALTGAEVAALLHISRQAVDKRRRAGQLLALALPRRGYLYPVWQFTEVGVLAGIPEVLAASGDRDVWSMARFFVSANDRLGGERPITALHRGDLAAVLQAARMEGEHGAA